MTDRRDLWLAVLLCVAGALLVLWGLSLPWAHYEDVGPGAIRHTVRGTQIRLDIRYVAIAALASTPALAATRSWLRVAVGVLVLLIGAYLTVRGVQVLFDSAQSVVVDDLARRGGCPLSTSHCAASSHVLGAPLLGRLVALLGALGVASSGLLTVARGRSWPGLGSSYEAPGAPPEPPVTDKGVWDALDRGDDPTA